MSGIDYLCYDETIDEDLLKFTVYKDNNDCEGFNFEGFSGKKYYFKSNSIWESGYEELKGHVKGF